jgi:hypothetical protein
MSTSAAVYIESLDRTVRVNSDGYPSHMRVALERLVDEELLEAFATRDEYSFVSDSLEAFDRYLLEWPTGRYVVVDKVGFAFPDDDSFQLTTLAYNGTYSFENDENFEYVIKPNGEVIVWRGEEN